MEKIKNTFEILATIGGIVNGFTFISQIRELREKKKSDQIPIQMYCAWVVILLVTAIHLFLQEDYWYGSSMVLSWVVCTTTLGVICYYRRYPGGCRSLSE